MQLKLSLESVLYIVSLVRNLLGHSLLGFHPDSPSSVVDDDRQLLNLITQSQVVRFLQQNISLLGDKRNTPISEMHGVMHDVYTINMRQKAIDAFRQLVDKVGIVPNSRWSIC